MDYSKIPHTKKFLEHIFGTDTIIGDTGYTYFDFALDYLRILCFREQKLPPLILYGGAPCGKSTFLIWLAELLGVTDVLHTNWNELNKDDLKSLEYLRGILIDGTCISDDLLKSLYYLNKSWENEDANFKGNFIVAANAKFYDSNIFFARKVVLLNINPIDNASKSPILYENLQKEIKLFENQLFNYYRESAAKASDIWFHGRIIDKIYHNFITQ